jgi:hypothetical protein
MSPTQVKRRARCERKTPYPSVEAAGAQVMAYRMLCAWIYPCGDQHGDRHWHITGNRNADSWSLAYKVLGGVLIAPAVELEAVSA